MNLHGCRLVSSIFVITEFDCILFLPQNKNRICTNEQLAYFLNLSHSLITVSNLSQINFQVFSQLFATFSLLPIFLILVKPIHTFSQHLTLSHTCSILSQLKNVDRDPICGCLSYTFLLTNSKICTCLIPFWN